MKRQTVSLGLTSLVGHAQTPVPDNAALAMMVALAQASEAILGHVRIVEFTGPLDWCKCHLQSLSPRYTIR